MHSMRGSSPCWPIVSPMLGHIRGTTRALGALVLLVFSVTWIRETAVLHKDIHLTAGSTGKRYWLKSYGGQEEGGRGGAC